MPKSQRIQELYEPLTEDFMFEQRKLFHTDAAYLDGRCYLSIAEGPQDPWRGMLVATSQEHHDSLQEQFPQLRPHDVLGKWLYLPLGNPDYEPVAMQLVELARKRDERLGVDPKPKKKKTKAKDKQYRTKTTKARAK